MKKVTSLLIICFLFSPFLVYAQEDPPEDPQEEEFAVVDDTPIVKGAFEIGLYAEAGFANNALTLNKIFQKTLILDLNELSDGLKVGINGVIPLFFNYDSNRGWGGGVSIGAEAAGNMDISGDMLSLGKIDQSNSILRGAVFAFIDIDSFYQLQKFKIMFSPAIYSTLIYVKSNISYVNKNIGQDTQLYIDLDHKVFTAFSPLALGLDFGAGVEYPLAAEIGLSDKYPLLDFDVGLDFVNIPIVPSTVKDHESTNVSLGIKEAGGLENMMSAFDTGDMPPVKGKADEMVYRPFKMLFRANWRLYPGDIPLSIIPVIGFSINPFYIDPAALEAGLKAHILLAKHFLIGAGIGYYDRLWKNNLDIGLNFKVFEFYLGADLRSQDFIKSWNGGFGLETGFKFKWGGNK